MQPNTVKKRRLEALSQRHGSHKKTRVKPLAEQEQLPQQLAGLGAGPVSISDALTHNTAAQNQLKADSLCQHDGDCGYPYQPLQSVRQQPPAHIATRLQLPDVATCKQNVEDLLERLMSPHMPLPTAQSMIAARTAPDKGVVLMNSSARVNLAKPSSSSKGQRHLLAAKLMPRAKRVQLTALPKSGIDYQAMLSLHELWCQYAAGVLSSSSRQTLDLVLQSLDWHGAHFRVTSSSNPIYLHRVGIVAKATRNTFVLVAEDGCCSVVPLKGSTFECSVDCGQLLRLSLSGNDLTTLKCVHQA